MGILISPVILIGLVKYVWAIPLTAFVFAFLNRYNRVVDILMTLFIFSISLCAALTLISLLMPTVINIVEPHLDKEFEWRTSQIIPNNMSPENKTRLILYIVNKNIQPTYYANENTTIFKTPTVATIEIITFSPYFCIRTPGDSFSVFPLVIGCGNCAEHSMAFYKIAKYAGIEARRINNPGGDHSFAEVYLNDSWITIETTNPNGFNVNVSSVPSIPTYIYAQYENGSVEDLTYKYGRKVGNVTVKVLNDGKPVRDVLLRVQALNPEIGNRDTNLRCKTDISGECKITLASRNYSFIFIDEKRQLARALNETEIKEGQNNITETLDGTLDNYYNYFNVGLIYLNEELLSILLPLLLTILLLVSAIGIDTTIKKLKTEKESDKDR